MTATSQLQDTPKCAVSVKDMAALCCLSRQRFAQLVRAGVFPAPLYDVATHRPFYAEDMQKVCLEVRRRNFGINGKAIMFYTRRSGPPAATPRSEKKLNGNHHAEIVDGLRALGLTSVSASQVGEAIRVVFPSGTASTEHAGIIRAVFIYLRRQNGGVNVTSK